MSNLIFIQNNKKYEVYPYDLGLGSGQNKGVMSWDDAIKSCKILNSRKSFHKLGGGWRLPNNEELNLLFMKKENLGIIPLRGYWSSDEYEIDNSFAYYQYFFNGVQYVFEKKLKSFVRPIRILE